MKVVDLHPEELLDKEARGELTELERERLEGHLARCATCRFERDVRADFAAELDDDAGLSSQRLDSLVERAHEEEKEAAVVPVVRTRRRGLRILLVAAAALFVGGIATAGIGTQVWSRLAGNGEEVTVNLPATPATAVPTPTPLAPSASSEHVVIERSESVVDAAVPAASAPAAPADTATSLFEAASQARQHGDYPQALALHRRLQSQFPLSREAHASQATVGRLLLDRGDAAGALASFDAYQTHGSGAFDEPVMIGRATALERLGRSDDARAAWQALVVAFPDTPWRSHAEAQRAP